MSHLLLCALTFAFVASSVGADTVTLSNNTAALPYPTSSFVLISLNEKIGRLGTIAPLTESAAQTITSSNALTSTLYPADTTTVTNITPSNIAYISCDPSDYPGNLQAIDVLSTAALRNATAALLYSNGSVYCTYTGNLDFRVFTMTNQTESGNLYRAAIQTLTAGSQLFFVTIRSDTDDSSANSSTGSSGNSSSNSSNNNPLGPSPSTAVAMIILYSITGVITALFLVIIITGAVRAHRHPERYGPRDILGRPRQSRARGLARAMLDTIPVVRFGERDASKPADVELAEEPREADATVPRDSSADNEDRNKTIEPTFGVVDSRTAKPPNSRDAMGIAPAEHPVNAETGSAGRKTPEASNVCSICTDDFERGQELRVLPCDHKFHSTCVDPWLLNVSGTCPLCRIDLRPTTSHTENESNERRRSGSLAPPLEQDAPWHRRRSMLREILRLRRMHEASTEERLAALRQLRENQTSNEAIPGASADISRRQRLSTRLHDVFSVRTRRTENAGAEGDLSHSNQFESRREEN